MSATAFLRHRRAAAVLYIQGALARSPKQIAELLETYGLAPGDLANLRANNDVLTIADEIAARKLDEEELDTLEQLNTLTIGERRAVHSPDVRADQVEDKLQHPCQETVGVSNMHDGPEAAEDLANVGTAEILRAYEPEEAATVDTSTREALADGADTKAERVEEAGKAADEAAGTPGTTGVASPLAAHANLPEVTANLGPVSDETTAEDDQEATDPDGKQAGIAATPVNIKEAAAALREEASADAKFAGQGDKAIDSMDRDALVAYAGELGIDLGDVKARTAPGTLRKQIHAALAAREPAPEGENS